MRFPNKFAFVLSTIVLGSLFGASSAVAHRFNVALVVPRSGYAEDESREIVNGFMLATRERDSHPDEESDGHLGGLDVYVTVLDVMGNLAADIGHRASGDEYDIVVAFAPDESRSNIGGQIEGTGVVMLWPGETPFANVELPAVVQFIAAYESEYGDWPTSLAAQGYNAARRIDAAVRDQGGVDDGASLTRVFGETEREFMW